MPPPPRPALVVSDYDVASDRVAGMRLSDKDITLYRKIFAAQRRGDTQAVDAMEEQLSDPSLMDWAHMKRDARNAGASIWLPPGAGDVARVYRSPLSRTARQQNTADAMGVSVAVLLKTDDVMRAEAMVRRAVAAGTIDRIEAAQAWADIAAAYLYGNRNARARKLADTALQIAGDVVPEAAWTAGLAAWKTGDYQQAGEYFAIAPHSPYADKNLRSASAYWAARAKMRTGEYKEVSTWLREAARSPRSFYGLIATRALGAKFEFNWSVPPLSATHMDVLAQYPGAVRALKLAQAGQMDMARLQLQLLDEDAAPQWREALAALAVEALKPETVLRIASLLEHPAGGSVDTALYPVAPWAPKDGYRLEPALINAFIRQESRFRPAATNKTSGATGLLQLMPRTALAVDKTTSREALSDPETSMMLGQKYLEELLDRTGGNLFEAAIAYNAGPGKLANWKDRFADVSDPLLFIELIPYAETRNYVEKVMANYWIYSLRMGAGGSGVASLNAVAGGHPAQYARATNRNSTQIVVGAVQDASASSR